MPESPSHKQKPRADPVSSWFNLPARGIMEVLGTVHMLSSSDLYPNVRATSQISAKRKPSAALAKLAANGNLTKLKYGSPVSTLHISRSRLIYLLSAKEFCWCIVRGELYWFTFTHPELGYNSTSCSFKKWRENAWVPFILVGFNAHRKKKITFSQFWLNLLTFKNANSACISLMGWNNNYNSAHTYRQRESLYFQTALKRRLKAKLRCSKAVLKIYSGGYVCDMVTHTHTLALVPLSLWPLALTSILLYILIQTLNPTQQLNSIILAVMIIMSIFSLIIISSLSKHIVTVSVNTVTMYCVYSKGTHSYGEKESNDLQPNARDHVVNCIYFTIPT